MSGVNEEQETKQRLLPLLVPMEESDSVLKKTWRRIIRHAGAVGQQTVYAVLLMYYAFRRKGIPIYARSIIIGALGYFVATFDAIPDLSPLIGYTDDLGVLSFGLVTIAAYINDDIRIKARKMLGVIFKDIDLESLKVVDQRL